MTLKGPDLSSYQATLDVKSVAADFFIIKATEGTNYVNPYCDIQYQAAKKLGKKLGVYHFAQNNVNTAQAEADFFVKNIKGYIGEAVLFLDWETGVSDTGWAKTFLDRVHSQTGIKPMIYMSESVVNSYNWSAVVAADYGLWVAKYADMAIDANYNMTHAGPAPSVKWWKGYAMWQWTSAGRLDGYSGNLDCNIFYGDGNAWDAYATASGKVNKVTQIVKAVASTIKHAVAKKPAKTTYYTVKQGDTLSALFPNSWNTVTAINGISNPDLIYAGQKLKLPSASTPKSSYYTVTARDADGLAAAMARIGRSNWQAVANLNGLKAPYTIYPGEKLRLP